MKTTTNRKAPFGEITNSAVNVFKEIRLNSSGAEKFHFLPEPIIVDKPQGRLKTEASAKE
jgi:hypothetical protein